MTLRLNQLSETGNCVKCSDCRCKEAIIFVQRTKIYNLVFGLWTSSCSAPLWLMKKAGGILNKKPFTLCKWSTRIWTLKFGTEFVLNEDVEFFLEEFRYFFKNQLRRVHGTFPICTHACMHTALLQLYKGGLALARTLDQGNASYCFSPHLLMPWAGSAQHANLPV